MDTLPGASASPFRSNAGKADKHCTGDAVISPTAPRVTKYLARRMELVLDDLGLLLFLPAGWVQAGPSGLVFGSLNLREADKFVLAVEDLHSGRSTAAPGSAGCNQLSLF